MCILCKLGQNGHTALHVAAKNQNTECLRMLLEAKAAVDRKQLVVLIWSFHHSMHTCSVGLHKLTAYLSDFMFI